jgi:hypothetical protein
LLDIVQATTSFRSGLMVGGAAMLTEYGPPDSPEPSADPAQELPGSNIGEGERKQAVERERARRFVRVRRGG